MADPTRGAGGRGRLARLAGTGEALAALAASECTVRRRARGRALSLPSRPEGDAGGAPASPDGERPGSGEGGGIGEGDEAGRVARSVARACRLVPWDPSCLVRALALERLLRRRGLEAARVRVGVRREGGDFAAHAWVEHRGEVVGDAPDHVRDYRPLPDLDVFPE